jgi:uncharacterized protein YndB with AHSA1/START domain
MAGTDPNSSREIVITRTFDAPRALVWEAWTDPKHFVHWWGPFPTVNPACEMDLRPGGKFRWVMRAPDGAQYPMSGEYKEIVRPERIVYTHSMAENPPAWHDMLNELRKASKGSMVPDGIVTVTFEDAAGKTKLTITTLFDSAATAEAFRGMQMVQGWGMSLDRLARVADCIEAEHAPPDHDVIVTRMFDAPRDLVFKMWTDPGHLAHWVIPKGFAPPIIEHMDARTGGSLRMRMKFSDGKTYLSQWSYVEVTPPQRIVYDELCDENGKPFHKARQIVEFAEYEGKTMLTIRGRIELLPDRDPRFTVEFMRAGWSQGWNDNFDNLASYLPKQHASKV